jgi:hypothetical protein
MVSTLIYEGHVVLGQVAECGGEPAIAFEHYERAIAVLRQI